MITNILNAAVGISAGVGALVSGLPAPTSHARAVGLAILLILTLINVRGVKDTGTAFLIPTYLFVGTLLLVIVVGAVRASQAGVIRRRWSSPLTCRNRVHVLPLATGQSLCQPDVPP